MDKPEITENGNRMITVYYAGIEIDFAREKGKVIEIARRSFTGGRAYYSPSDYTKVIKAACDHWGLPFPPRLFTVAAISTRRRQNKKARSAKGVQNKMF